jgi:hypothetical protein
MAQKKSQLVRLQSQPTVLQQCISTVVVIFWALGGKVK